MKTIIYDGYWKKTERIEDVDDKEVNCLQLKQMKDKNNKIIGCQIENFLHFSYTNEENANKDEKAGTV